MTITLSKRELEIIFDSLTYYLDHNEEIDFADEEVNAIYERITEAKADA